jgi:hypothetical protein
MLGSTQFLRPSQENGVELEVTLSVSIRQLNRALQNQREPELSTREREP